MFLEKMRHKDIEQACLLEEKLTLYTECLLKSNVILNPNERDDVQAFLSNFGTYRDLINDESDSIEVSRRVLYAIQEISRLSSSLYKAATGHEVPVRSYNHLGEQQRQTEQPKLPMRAETFGGFDERRIKLQQTHPYDVTTTINNQLHQYDDNKYLNNNSSISSSSTVTSDENCSLINKDHYAALQVSHHLNTLFSIINQQMTTIASLQTQSNSRSIFRHNDQLEELRNAQDKFQEDKTTWLKQKELDEKELKEMHLKYDKMSMEEKAFIENEKKQIKAAQEDVRQQRESLYAQMQKLANQGILLSPNVANPSTNIICSDDSGSHQAQNSSNTTDDHTDLGGGGGALAPEHRRKEKWRSASSKYFDERYLFILIFFNLNLIKLVL